MNSCCNKEITMQLIYQEKLDSLRQIIFNKESSILITMQKSNINSYFFKNDSLKRISSILVTMYQYYQQLLYLQVSNSYIAIPKSQILISTLTNLNLRKILLKIGHDLGACYNSLLNKNENILFISNYNQIQVFSKEFNEWKCTDILQSISNRDNVEQMCLSLDEECLLVQTSNSYCGTPGILVFRKKLKDNQVQWILKQKISQDNGEIWGFVSNCQFITLDQFSLMIYTKDQLDKFQNSISIDFKNLPYQQKSFAISHNKQKLLIITRDNISILQLEANEKLTFKQSITIDLSELLYVNPASIQFSSILTKDDRYLIIWNEKKTEIRKIMNM